MKGYSDMFEDNSKGIDVKSVKIGLKKKKDVIICFFLMLFFY